MKPKLIPSGSWLPLVVGAAGLPSEGVTNVWSARSPTDDDPEDFTVPILKQTA
jgi:hypothetical protein